MGGRRNRVRKQQAEGVLGLYDLLTGQYVWRMVFPTHRPWLSGVRAIGLGSCGRTGILEMINLQTGEPEFESNLGLTALERPFVNGMGVTTHGDRYLIHLKRGEAYNRVEIDSSNVELKYLNYSDSMWVGYLICIDAETGKGRWHQPVRFDNFQLGQNQPVNLPVYFLTRRVEMDDEFGNRRDYVNFVGVSMETGELLINDLILNGYPNLTRYDCDLENGTATVKFATTELKYRFSSPDDLPPRPVAHLTNENSVPKIVNVAPQILFRQAIHRKTKS